MNKELSILERLQAPVPTLFAKIRNISLVLVAIGGAIMALQTQDFALPSLVTWIANKATLIGGVVAAIIAQLTVDTDKLSKQKALDGIKK